MYSMISPLNSVPSLTKRKTPSGERYNTCVCSKRTAAFFASSLCLARSRIHCSC